MRKMLVEVTSVWQRPSPRKCIDGCIRAFLTVTSAELPEARLAADQLGQDEAHRGEHGEAPVVELLVAHVRVVHAQAEGVAEIARLLGRVLLPDLTILYYTVL